MALPHPKPGRRGNDTSELVRGSQKCEAGKGTKDLVRKTDVAKLLTPGVGQVRVVIRKLFLALLPLLGQVWVCAAF